MEILDNDTAKEFNELSEAARRDILVFIGIDQSFDEVAKEYPGKSHAEILDITVATSAISDELCKHVRRRVYLKVLEDVRQKLSSSPM